MSNNPQNWFGEFRRDLGDLLLRLPNKMFFFGIFAAWVILFQLFGHRSFNFTQSPSLFSWMWGAYSAPALDSGHGKLIPFAVILLLWAKRQELVEQVGKVWWPGFIGLFLAVILHIVAYAIQQPRLSIVAFVGGVYSLVGMAWGYRFIRATFFPFILFAFAVPVGNSIQALTVPLRLFATTATRFVASGFGIELIQEGNQLFDPAERHVYEIVDACSGIRSLIPVIAIVFIYAMLSFKTLGKRLVLLAFAIPFAVMCNILRVLAIVLARNIFDEHAALYVHEWFGFVTYLLTLAGAFLLGALLTRKTARIALKGGSL